MVHILANFKTKQEKENKFLECQVKALIEYNLACANAARKLVADLEKCKKVLVTVKSSKRKK